MFLLQITTVPGGSIVQNFIASVASSPFWLKVYFYLKTITIIYTVILLIAVVLVLVNASRQRRAMKKSEEAPQPASASIKKEEGKEAESLSDKWGAILELLNGKDEPSWRMAVTEADKFFDEIMQRLGYSGDNFGERLKQIHPTEIKNLDNVWDAHRVRNSLAHDVDFKLSQDDARRAVGAYEEAMRDLDVF